MQTNQNVIPSKIAVQVKGAAAMASKALKRDYGIEVSTDALREQGAAIIAEQVALTGGRHPDTPAALSLLRRVLRDMMIEHATAH